MDGVVGLVPPDYQARLLLLTHPLVCLFPDKAEPGLAQSQDIVVLEVFLNVYIVFDLSLVEATEIEHGEMIPPKHDLTVLS